MSEVKPTDSVVIRDARSTDVPFILNSWLKSWRVSKYSGCIRNDKYYEVQRDTIEGLVARGAKFKVAAYSEDDNHILGWLCYEKLQDGKDTFAIHYFYVKDAYFKIGVPAVLIADCPEIGLYSHKFSQVVEYFPKYRWAPEIARRK